MSEYLHISFLHYFFFSHIYLLFICTFLSVAPVRGVRRVSVVAAVAAVYGGSVGALVAVCCRASGADGGRVVRITALSWSSDAVVTLEVFDALLYVPFSLLLPT